MNPVLHFADIVRLQRNCLQRVCHMDADGDELTAQDVLNLIDNAISSGIAVEQTRGVSKWQSNSGQNGNIRSVLSAVLDFDKPLRQAKAAAIQYCIERPAYYTVPAEVADMALIHHKWTRYVLQSHDSGIAELSESWDAIYSQLCDWVDEIDADLESATPSGVGAIQEVKLPNRKFRKMMVHQWLLTQSGRPYTSIASLAKACKAAIGFGSAGSIQAVINSSERLIAWTEDREVPLDFLENIEPATYDTASDDELIEAFVKSQEYKSAPEDMQKQLLDAFKNAPSDMKASLIQSS